MHTCTYEKRDFYSDEFDHLCAMICLKDLLNNAVQDNAKLIIIDKLVFVENQLQKLYQEK